MKYLIFLHPLNHDSSVITPFKTLIGMLGFKLIAPNSPDPGKWFEILEWGPRQEGDRILFNEDKAGIQKARDYVERVIDKLIYRDVKPQDIYLMGFSQGGCVATYYGYTGKHNLGKVVGICSYVPLITDSEEEGKFQKDRKICLINGTEDEVVKPEFIKLIAERYPYVDINWVKCGHKPEPRILLQILEKLVL